LPIIFLELVSRQRGCGEITAKISGWRRANIPKRVSHLGIKVGAIPSGDRMAIAKTFLYSPKLAVFPKIEIETVRSIRT
jgi:hypothetical protein